VPPAPKIVPVAKSPVVAIRNILSPSSEPQKATDLEISNTLLWPAKSRRINQYYSWRHRGLDIDGDVGDPAYAPESGKVEKSGWGTGYGYHVIINHGNGIKTLQGHFSKLLVKTGDTVERGDQIAEIGSTGWSTGAHIHFEVIVNGVKVNPFTYTK
jgi:murein DD-endopeptidase MepM/ murein hydrolase activator NlpD